MHNIVMKSFRDVMLSFEAEGSNRARLRHFADLLGSEVGKVFSDNTVASWDRRNSLPPEYWKPTVELARRHKVAGVTYEFLAGLRAQAA